MGRTLGGRSRKDNPPHFGNGLAPRRADGPEEAAISRGVIVSHSDLRHRRVRSANSWDDPAVEHNGGDHRVRRIPIADAELVRQHHGAVVMADVHDRKRPMLVVAGSKEITGREIACVVACSGEASGWRRIVLVAADGRGIGNGQAHDDVLSEILTGKGTMLLALSGSPDLRGYGRRAHDSRCRGPRTAAVPTPGPAVVSALPTVLRISGNYWIVYRINRPTCWPVRSAIPDWS